jgi:hypothetical protein
VPAQRTHVIPLAFSFVSAAFSLVRAALSLVRAAFSLVSAACLPFWGLRAPLVMLRLA